MLGKTHYSHYSLITDLTSSSLPAKSDSRHLPVTESHENLQQSNLACGGLCLHRSLCEESGWSLEAGIPQTLQVAQFEQNHLPKEEVIVPIHQVTLGTSAAPMIDTRCGRPGATKMKAVHSRQ